MQFGPRYVAILCSVLVACGGNVRQGSAIVQDPGSTDGGTLASTSADAGVVANDGGVTGTGTSPADAGTSSTPPATSDPGTGTPVGGSTPPDGTTGTGSTGASTCDALRPALSAALERTFDTGTHAACSFATSSPSGQVAFGFHSTSDWVELSSSDGTNSQGRLDGLYLSSVELDASFHPTAIGWRGMVHLPPPAVGLASWDASGASLGQLPVFAVSSSPDASGGSVLLGRAQDATSLGPTQLIWVSAGGSATRSVTLDAHPTAVQVAWASGNVLVLTPTMPAARARWYDADGAALTPWFDVPAGSAQGYASFSPRLRLLLDGRIAVGDSTGWLAVISDGVGTAEPLPAWLAARPSTRLASVLGGRAYAVLPTAGGPTTADAARFEIITSAGESCGTVVVPDRAPEAGVTAQPRRLDVGWDGTLFQISETSGPALGTFGAHCAVRWWPGALQ